MSYSNDLSPKNVGTDEDDVMYVITRTGRREALDTNQITRRLQSLINRSPKIPHVNPYELMLEVCKGLKSGITTYEIDEYAANASASLSITNPYYLKIAARIAIDNHQKNTQRSFVDKMRTLYLNQDDQGKINSLIAQNFFKYVEEYQDFIERTIDYNRDFYLDFFGFQTFIRSYSMKVDDKSIERPQDMFMRTAVDLHMGTCDTIEEELQNIKTTYEALSLKFYTHASPTYYNAGSEKKQYASCFLLGTRDSREGIMRTADHISEISKYSGGIGVHINCLRGAGAKIRGTNGRSSGIVPWLKIYNEVMKGFNQGGRRPGSAAFYIMPHHPDIMKFIEITRNGGTEEMRARAIFTSLWIPDIFMERVRDGALWSTFDPDTCGDLSDFTGEEYRKKYLELEAKKLYTSQIPARKIWEACMDTNSDVGRLYVCFADTANEMFMQKNIGVLKSSNLCSEVFLYSNAEEYAVCILSSIALPTFVLDGYSEEELKQPEDLRRKLNHEFPVNPYFDFKKLIEITKLITTNLNLIIDKTFHPLKETKRGSDRHRPIGIGVQGLDDCYAKMRYPFKSDAAHDLNKKIFETIYFAVITQSSVLARKIYQSLKKKCKLEGKLVVQEHQSDSYDLIEKVYNNPDEIPQTVGAYPSMLWNGGSPIGNGIFHWELAGLKPNQLSGMFDWESLREHIKTFGVRNSLTVACMPTASTSQLLGNNECLAKGTLVTLSDGTNIPIEEIKVGAKISTYSEKNGGLINSTVSQVLNKGKKDVIKLTFIDGTTIICTPDHKFMLENNEWCEARNIPILGESVKLGLRGTTDIVGSDEEGWYVDSKNFVLDMSTPEKREKALIFSRIVGFIRADGSVQPGKVTAIFGSKIDRDSFMNDFQKLDATPSNITFRVNERNYYEVVMQGPISIAIGHLPGMANNCRVSSTPTWPDFVTDSNCPKAILREFLAGLFGGDGCAPILIKNKNQTPMFSPIKFAQTSCKIHADVHRANMKQLCTLLERCGVPNATIINERITKCSTDTYQCGEKEHICIRIGLPLDATVQYLFMEKIGIRYCSNKAYKCSIAAMWSKYINEVIRQNTTVLTAALENNLTNAIESLKQTEPLLNDYYSDPTLDHVYDYKRRSSDKMKQLKSKFVMNAEQFLEQINASHMFNNITYATNLTDETLPTLQLQLLDRRPWNSSDVYDINVSNTHTFIANGAIVHNCIEPYTSNIYKRNTLAGEYIVVKKHLMDDLYRLGLWSNSIKDYLLASSGSIQHIDGIPDHIKELYPTVWEIDQEVLVQQSIDRQPFVDQGQSLNLYVENLNMAIWNKLMFKAWKGKLKTGKYYLHSRPAVTPQKFTIDPSKQEEMRKLFEKNKHGTAFMEPLREVCEVCSS